MIYDTLNNLPNYLGVSDNLDTVIEYIMAPPCPPDAPASTAKRLWSL